MNFSDRQNTKKIMSESIKANHATVAIGDLTVDGFQLPDGSYRMSQSGAADAVGLSKQNVSDFLRSNAIKTLLGEGYTSPISASEQIDIESEGDKRGQSRFNSLPLEIDADIRRERDYLLTWLRDKGLDPYALIDGGEKTK